MARARTSHNSRTISQPQQRELFPVEQELHQYSRQRGSELDSPTGLSGPVRRFEILKSTPLGLVFPQNVYFSVKDVDAGIAHTGHRFEISSDEPMFVTSELKWWKQGYILPPSFEILPGGAHRHATRKRTHERQGTQAGEVSGLPPSPSHDGIACGFRGTQDLSDNGEHKPYPLAEIKYHGWEGVSNLSTSLTLYNITPDMHYAHKITAGAHSMPEIRSQYSIVRVGWKREYILGPLGHKWRSPSLPEKSKLLSKSALDDTLPIVHGNLILEDAHMNVVALYKQRRDWEVLGTLTVSSEYVHDHQQQEHRNDGQEGKITIEAVVASCLAVVIYERVGWQNAWGN